MEAEHGAYTAFDVSVILLNDVVHVLAGMNGDQIASGLQSGLVGCRRW